MLPPITLGLVDTIVSGLERPGKNFAAGEAAFTVKALTNALLEAEEIFLSGDPEDLDAGKEE